MKKLLVTLLLLLPNIALADSGISGGGVFSRSISQVTDGTNTCYPYAIHVTSNSCSNGVATISSGAATGYQTIQDETTPLAQETTLNFTGAGVTCVDNAGNTRTDCTIPGGGGSSQWITYGQAGNVGIGTTDSVGIGTTLQTGAGLVVMNGNVGIGTWKPSVALNIPVGNVGIGTATPGSFNVDILGSMRVTSITIPAITLATITDNNGFVFTRTLSTDSSTRSYATVTGTGHSSSTAGSGTVGLKGSSSANHTSTTQVNYGVQGLAIDVNASGSNYRAAGVYGNIQRNGAGGTTTNGYGVFGDSATITAGTLTNNYAGGFNGRLIVSGNIGIGTVLDGDNFLTTPPPAGGMIIEGNMGIGSLTPGSKLDVIGTVRAVGFTANNIIGSTQCLHADTNGAITGTGSDCGSGGSATAAGGTRAIQYNSGSSTFAGDETKFSFDGTNVGIGTNKAQSASLEIVKASTNPYFMASSTNAGTGDIFAINNTGTVSIGTAYNGAGLNIGDVGANINYAQMWATDNTTDHFLTFGTTDRTHFLTFYPGHATNPNTSIYFPNTAGSIFRIDGVDAFSPSSFVTGLSVAGDTGNVGIGNLAPGVKLDVTGDIRALNTNHIYLGNDTVTALQTSAATAGDLKVLTNSVENTRFTNGGNVGINSATPGQRLDVVGTVRATGFNAQNIQGSTQCIHADSNGNFTGTGTDCGSGGSSQWITYGQAGNVGIGTSDSVGIGTTLQTGARLVVFGGNVGIGTWTPQAALQVMGGNVSIGTSASLNYLTVGSTTNVFTVGPTGITTTTQGMNSPTLNGGGAATSSLSLVSTTGTGTTDFIRFLVTGAPGNEAMRILHGGNIGIGTTVPKSKLSIQGNVGIGTMGGNYLNNTAPLNGLIVEGNVGLGTWVPTHTLALGNGVISSQWGSPIPVISSCGSAPSPSVKGTDQDFEITVGGTATACTATFGGTYADAICTVTNQSMSVTNALTYTVSSTAVVLSQAVGLSGDLVDIHCGFKN